jgi:hypothetical protein
MMELDAFPEELRRRVLEVGQVLRMEMFPEDKVQPKKGISKEKRFVIIGKDGDRVVAALLINSEINQNLFMQIGPYQHLIRSKRYDFLDHDSYVDGYLIREFDADRVMQSATYLGSLDLNDVKESIQRAVASPKLKPYIIKRYKLI